MLNTCYFVERVKISSDGIKVLTVLVIFEKDSCCSTAVEAVGVEFKIQGLLIFLNYFS